jgi:hypothetical protein
MDQHPPHHRMFFHRVERHQRLVDLVLVGLGGP